MRKIFSSQRLETVEGVAALLRRHDIEVRISNPRSYKGGRRREFSFLERPKDAELSAVWIVQVDQQPRARELLREAGLLDSTRPGRDNADEAWDSYATGRDRSGSHPGDADASLAGGTPAPARHWAWRIRLGLLLLIAAAVMFVSLRHRGAPEAATPETETPDAPVSPQATDEDEVRVRLQPASPQPPNP